MGRLLRKETENYSLKVTYIRYRNFCNKLLKSLKHAYEKNEFTKAKSNIKATWNVVKSIINTEIKASPATELLKSESDPKVSIEKINDFFASIGRDLAVQHTNDPFTSNASARDICPLNSLVLLPTDETEVENIIRGLRGDSAVGFDGIASRLIQMCSHSLIPPITHICNIAIETGVFPTIFKKAIVHPIYKNGDRDSVNNYRPISILPALSKILEKILNLRLMDFLTKHNILANNQFGFRNGKSTEDAVASFVDNLTDRMDNKQRCIGVFLDLAKAFDTVSVSKLIAKMDGVGIRGHSLKIFESYLSNRTQCVKIGTLTSDFTSVSYGVPQGSILGPTLFLIYINSLCNLSIPNCSIYTYADDTALLIHGSSWTETFFLAESALKSVMEWLSSNRLTLNIHKTMYLAFTPTACTQPNPETFKLRAHRCQSEDDGNCNCPAIVETDCIKYLGVIIDKHLNWHGHVNSLTSRVRKLICVFKKLRHSAGLDVLKLVYCSLCQTIVTYCISVWGGAAKTILLPLERAQRAVLKVIYCKPFRHPTTLLYNECKLLTVRKIFVLQTVLRKHNTIQYIPENRNTRRSHRVCPSVSYRTALAKRHFGVIAGHLYNTLNRYCGIYGLSKFEIKIRVTDWLLDQDYEQTEMLLKLTVL